MKASQLKETNTHPVRGGEERKAKTKAGPAMKKLSIISMCVSKQAVLAFVRSWKTTSCGRGITLFVISLGLEGEVRSWTIINASNLNCQGKLGFPEEVSSSWGLRICIYRDAIMVHI